MVSSLLHRTCTNFTPSCTCLPDNLLCHDANRLRNKFQDNSLRNRVQQLLSWLSHALMQKKKDTFSYKQTTNQRGATQKVKLFRCEGNVWRKWRPENLLWEPRLIEMILRMSYLFLSGNWSRSHSSILQPFEQEKCSCDSAWAFKHEILGTHSRSSPKMETTTG